MNEGLRKPRLSTAKPDLAVRGIIDRQKHLSENTLKRINQIENAVCSPSVFQSKTDQLPDEEIRPSCERSFATPVDGARRRFFEQMLPVVAMLGALWLLCGAVNGAEMGRLQGLKLPQGFRATIFADEAQIGNAVAICFDRQERLFATEITRRKTGVWGVTFSRWWAMEDYAATTLEDRQAMYNRWAHIVPPAILTRKADRVRLLTDTNLDGRADTSIVFADGFNDALDGNAAGIIVRDDDVFLANIPHLWRLRDLDRDGVADKREPLLSGFGVRVGVHAHDLHGLTWGPDGRLYFSIGDRGFHVRTKEGHTLSAPRRGAAFRCFPDGTGLEVFHHGLRNPQELAFNQWGDLFTVDNDMGGADNCRVLHLTEDGDSAWNAAYQLTRNFRKETDRANHTEPPWFTERLWDTRCDEQPAWVNPAISHLTRGPSGLAYSPGPAIAGVEPDTFLICDFVGSSARSGVWSFKLKRSGAGYSMASTNQFAWGVLPSDVTFGPDGNIYLTDWMNGWGGEGKRRLLRISHQSGGTKHTRAARSELRRNLSQASTEALAQNLGFADMRVRLRAQYELAKRGAAGWNAFVQLGDAPNLHARIHRIWGLWQMGLRESPPRKAVLALLRVLENSAEPELRAQAAKVLGELRIATAADALTSRLRDRNPRVVYAATIALGKLQHNGALGDIAAMLRRNADKDVELRHAGVYALTRCANPKDLTQLYKLQTGGGDAVRALKRAIALALRKQQAPEILSLLDDEDPEIAAMAVRAIHDAPIVEVWDELAERMSSPLARDKTTPFPVKHRILNVNFRLGGTNNAARLAAVAADKASEHAVRMEALNALAKWRSPSSFDRVTWHYRPLERKRAETIGAYIRQSVLGVFNSTMSAKKSNEAGALRLAAAGLIANYDLANAEMLKRVALDTDISPDVRRRFLTKLIRGDNAENVCATLLTDNNTELRMAAAAHLAQNEHAPAEAALAETLAKGDERSARIALRAVSGLDTPFARAMILNRANAAMQKAEVTPLTLDEFIAVRKMETESARRLTEKMAASYSDNGHPLGLHQMALKGGDAKRGRLLFETHAAQCVRCHRVKGFGGEAGPDLSKIGRELDRAGLIAALIDPPARIAPGYGAVEFELADDELISGFVDNETDASVSVRTIDGRFMKLDKRSIVSRSKARSAMPSMREALSLSEIRDVVTYLSRLK